MQSLNMSILSTTDIEMALLLSSLLFGSSEAGRVWPLLSTDQVCGTTRCHSAISSPLSVCFEMAKCIYRQIEREEAVAGASSASASSSATTKQVFVCLVQTATFLS